MRTIGLMVAAVVMTTALTGCGSGDGDGSGSGGVDFADGSAEQILDAMRADMTKVESAEVTGATPVGDLAFSFDMHTDANGTCTGTVRVDDGKAALIGVAGGRWIKPDKTFWRATARTPEAADAMIAATGDNWVVAPDNEAFHDLCDLDELIGGFTTTRPDDGSTYTNKGTAALDGEPVVVVEEADDHGTASIYVRVQAPHYVVMVKPTSGGDAAPSTFSDFNTPVEVETPAQDEIFDPQSLGS